MRFKDQEGWKAKPSATPFFVSEIFFQKLFETKVQCVEV